MLSCVINVSEGRDDAVLATLAAAAGGAVLDIHRDPDHHRAVFTLAGPSVTDSARALTAAAVSTIDLRRHRGVHPRTGAVDVVPWVHYEQGSGRLRQGGAGPAVAARAAFARWAGASGLPAVLYGPAAPGGWGLRAVPQRTLPEVRRRSSDGLVPDAGPPVAHPSAGVVTVGARRALVAYNLWLVDADLALARRIAAEVRRDPRCRGAVRTLGLEVGAEVQVSCNLVDPWATGPDAAFDAVAARAAVARAELVGLLPGAVLATVPRHRWVELDLDPSTTIEARLEQAGLDGGRTW